MLDLQAGDRRADRLLVLAGREAGGVDGHHAQTVAGVALVPCLDVRQRPQRAGTAEVPELDEHGAAALLVHAQGSDVDPGDLHREGRSGDVVDRRAHGAATLADRNSAATLRPM
jgi:hypothetical protein